VKRPRSYPYDRSSFIARPTLPFYVMPPDGLGGLHPGRGLLDTGSTLCSIPLRTLSALELAPVAVYRVEDADGSLHDVDAYDVHLTVPEHFSAPVRVLATASEEPLIGRDVMDSWRLTLDGPRRQIEVESV
jgi:predicted aspartyl protease